MDSECTQLTQQELQFPSRGWQTFPSVSIPSMFNYGHIYFYLVESMPTLIEELDSDCEEPRGLCADPFDEENQSINEVQVLRKGLRYFKSNFVRSVQDICEGRCYFVKAQVRASMLMVAHNTSVAISLRSGTVHKCKCTCVAQSLGRCSHVCAVLLFIWSHIRLNGYGGKVKYLESRWYILICEEKLTIFIK